MALTSVFYDGWVTETDRATNRAGAADYGVIGADDFRVSTHPSIPYALNIAAGKAHGYGVSDTATATQVVQCATLASGTRFDLIVVRRNWQPLLGGPSTLVAIQGGSTIPNIQTLRTIGPGVEDDQPLALVEWRGNVNTPYRIIDLRCWAGNGGVVAADVLALDYLARPGADVLIGATTWRYAIGANGAWGWTSNQAQTLSPLQVPGYTVSGPITVTSEGDKKRVTANLEIKRTSTATASFGGPAFTDLGVVIPVAARVSLSLYLPVVISGMGQRATAHAYIGAGNGVVGLRAESGTISLPRLANIYLYFTYLI